MTAIDGKVSRYVRFQQAAGVSYGLRENGFIRELAGNIFEGATPTGREFDASAVRLLVPCEPSKVIAVGLNYASHRVHVEKEEGPFVTVAGTPPTTDGPVVFAKFPTSLIPDGQDIVFPDDATNVHFEGETTCSACRSPTTSSTATGCWATCNGSAPRAPTISVRWARPS